LFPFNSLQNLNFSINRLNSSVNSAEEPFFLFEPTDFAPSQYHGSADHSPSCREHALAPPARIRYQFTPNEALLSIGHGFGGFDHNNEWLQWKTPRPRAAGTSRHR
jgi:hypothetical protein